jgi:hypothetical protein
MLLQDLLNTPDPETDWNEFEYQFQNYCRRHGQLPPRTRDLRDDLIFMGVIANDGKCAMPWLKDRVGRPGADYETVDYDADGNRGHRK